MKNLPVNDYRGPRSSTLTLIKNTPPNEEQSTEGFRLMALVRFLKNSRAIVGNVEHRDAASNNVNSPCAASIGSIARHIYSRCSEISALGHFIEKSRAELPQDTVAFLNRCRVEGAQAFKAQRPRAAARHHRRIIKAIKSAGIAEDPLVVSYIHSLGQIFLNFGEHRLALWFLQEAYEISVRVFGKDEMSTIMIETDHALTQRLVADDGLFRKWEGFVSRVFPARARS